jgi:signal peptidase I
VTATTEAATEGPAGFDAGPEKEKPSTLRNLVEWVAILGAALLVAFVVKTFLIQAFFIPSPSMVPTLEVHDRVLVNKLSYKLHDVHRGDVVVFERLPEEHGAIKDLIKRVVAIEGDTVETRGNTLYVNDQAVVEPYVKTSDIGNPVLKRTIPENQVFVMGDNRSNSADSRVFGPVDEDRIVGRAFVKIWPLSSLRLL